MSPSHTAFFYGTLMHPKILERVIKNDGNHLEICPGVLLGHTRHRVKDAEYPGVVPYDRGRQLFDRDLNQEERSVRGTIVRGLTPLDIHYLDIFEGDEYERLPVLPHPLEPFSALNSSITEKDPKRDESYFLPQHATPLPAVADLPPAVEAQTYIFLDLNSLEPVLWSFDDFVEKNAWKWYSGSSSGFESGSGSGSSARDSEEMSVEDGAELSEVEKRRAAMEAMLDNPWSSDLKSAD